MTDKNSKHPKESHPEGRLRDEILVKLNRVEGGAWANRMSHSTVLPDVDRRRVSEYVGGITRRRRWLDFLINTFSSRPDSMDPVVRQILRIGVYELVELRRAPHTAVFASVEQAKRIASGGVGNFVNGVLRALSRSIETLPTPESGDDTVDAAIVLSHPDWMARRWVERFGLEGARLLMEYNNGRPVHSVRVNTLKTTPDEITQIFDSLGVEWDRSRYLQEFLRVSQLQPVIAAGLLDSGVAAVQDESAGLVSRVLNPQPGEYIIDACAAPGGKMIHSAMLMNNEGRLVGIDMNKKRLEGGLSTARSHGLSIIETRQGDLRSLTPSDRLPVADAVLIDVPCSGLGVLSRRPDMRWRRQENSIPDLVRLQDELLDAAAPFVRPGGRLIYATCTITPEENEERVAAFLSRNPEFEFKPVPGEIPDEVVDGGCLVTLPHVHQIDGAFSAQMVRR